MKVPQVRQQMPDGTGDVIAVAAVFGQGLDSDAGRIAADELAHPARQLARPARRRSRRSCAAASAAARRRDSCPRINSRYDASAWMSDASSAKFSASSGSSKHSMKRASSCLPALGASPRRRLRSCRRSGTAGSPTSTALPRSPGSTVIPMANVRETRLMMPRANSSASRSSTALVGRCASKLKHHSSVLSVLSAVRRTRCRTPPCIAARRRTTRRRRDKKAACDAARTHRLALLCERATSRFITGHHSRATASPFPPAPPRCGPAMKRATSPVRRNVLCVFPHYTPSFGTFEHAYPFVGVKAFMPPQGILVIANYMPANWQVRFIDENVRRAGAADFHWADVVFVSGMHIQRPQIGDINRRAHAYGKVTALGGPSVSGCPGILSGVRLSARRRAGRCDGRVGRAPDARASRGRRQQIRLETVERLPLAGFPDPGVRSDRRRAVFLGQRAVFERLPVPLRILRHPRAVRPQSAAEDAGADRRRTRCDPRQRRPALDLLRRR